MKIQTTKTTQEETPSRHTQTKLRREDFKSTGLTYDDVTKADIDVLIDLINQYGAAHKNMKMTVARVLKKDFSFRADGSIIKGYIKVKGPYFDKREAISFNEGGFIGFAGWADKYNIQPFVHAFDGWLKLKQKGDNGNEI